jgi:predicted nucleic acid-binding protein
LEDPSTRLAVSALTLVEFNGWLRKEELSLSDQEEAIRECVELVDFVAPVTHEIAGLAVDIRKQTARRIPTVDLVIAATAALNAAVLVHRDDHFSTLPPGLPNQMMLPPKT